MRYAVITTDGTLTHRTRGGDAVDTVWAEAGPEGPVLVRLDEASAMAGWVNDVGLTRPETYPRNVVGSCVLAALGAGAQPYAGPVVVTGWDPHGMPTEICSLPEFELVTRLHGRVHAALRGDPDEITTEWGHALRTYADWVREASAPGMTIHHV